MKRRIVIPLTALAAAVVLHSASAAFGADSAAAARRMGFLAAGSAKVFAPRMASFRDGLARLGYREGAGVVIEERYAEGHRDRLPALAAELVALRVDIILTNGATATRAAGDAANAAGRTIPIVFALAPDPVGQGLVESLARPGGDITGLTNAGGALVAKRLELLVETVPSARRIAVLRGHPRTTSGREVATLRAMAPKLGVAIVTIAFDRPDNLDRVFATLRDARPDALIVLGDSVINAHRGPIAARARALGLPTMFSGPSAVRAGGLMSYGANTNGLYRRAAAYVDRILKGAKPADLPIEFPTEFDFAVNLKTAKALGLNLPRPILLRATEVIE